MLSFSHSPSSNWWGLAAKTPVLVDCNVFDDAHRRAAVIRPWSAVELPSFFFRSFRRLFVDFVCFWANFCVASWVNFVAREQVCSLVSGWAMVYFDGGRSRSRVFPPVFVVIG